MTATSRRLAGIESELERIADALEKPAPKVEQHFHAKTDGDVDVEARLRAANPFPNSGRVFAAPVDTDPDDFDRKAVERELGLAEVQHPLARVAVLTVALNLKNRLDAMRTIDGADVLEVIGRYEEVQALRNLLGPVTGAETMKATALYDTLAT